MQDIIHVHPEGYLDFHELHFRCALGKGGVRHHKREGDGATPIGTYALRAVYYRADKVSLPPVALPSHIINPAMGWCDDPADAQYNRLVVLPFAAHHEEMWREDDCYDVVVEIGYNDHPIAPGRGSAIFLHVARPGYEPTEGCVALAKEDLLKLLPRLTAATKIHIHPSKHTE